MAHMCTALKREKREKREWRERVRENERELLREGRGREERE
jgi:hypothetical protein